MDRTVAVLIIGGVAIISSVLCIFLMFRLSKLRNNLEIAVRAAEDSARAAALAAPGGIDPEAVVTLLRNGQPASLDAIYQLMERQSATVDT